MNFFFKNHNNFYEIKVLYSKPLIALSFIQTLLLLQLSLFLVPNSFKVSIAKPTEHTHTHWEKWIVVHYFSTPLFSQLPLISNLLHSKTNHFFSDNLQLSLQTLVLLPNTNPYPLFTPTASESSNGTSSVTLSLPLPPLPLAAKPQRSLSLSLKLCFKFSMNVSSLFLFLFSLCVRHSCGLWIKRTKRVWGFWKRPMRPWKCTTMVVVDWTLPALMLFLLVHCS